MMNLKKLKLPREFDFDTGLQFNRMRYYNSYLGRFMQKDMVIYYDNLYFYGLNDPLNHWDPFGLSILDCFRIIRIEDCFSKDTQNECYSCCFSNYSESIKACRCPLRTAACYAAAQRTYQDCKAGCASLY